MKMSIIFTAAQAGGLVNPGIFSAAEQVVEIDGCSVRLELEGDRAYLVARNPAEVPVRIEERVQVWLAPQTFHAGLRPYEPGGELVIDELVPAGAELGQALPGRRVPADEPTSATWLAVVVDERPPQAWTEGLLWLSAAVLRAT